MYNILSRNILISLILFWIFIGCRPADDNADKLTLIFINDQHGQIDQFAKLSYLIEEEKKQGEVLVLCAGDIFSGNPVVDIYEEKGYPMIDLMNRVGFDICAMGNHEFDYGKEVLSERMDQSSFEWICANVDMGETGIPKVDAYSSIQIGELKITFLGLIETNGKADLNIPSTHPAKLEGIHFTRPEEIIQQYANLKEEENADLLIALTHLGHNYENGKLGDFQLADQFPFFDLIIGGHSSVLLDTVINDIPIFQAGKYLEFVGKAEIFIKDSKISDYSFELIDMENYPFRKADIQTIIEGYDQAMAGFLDEVIGYSELDHERNEVGCFYTDALRASMGVDLSFQNFGGVRAGLNEGNITVREIYEIDPFNNGALIYAMTCIEIKEFLMGTQSWHCFSGIGIEQSGNEIILRYLDGSEIENENILRVGINDYIPAVYDSYFPDYGEFQSYTTAQALINYLKNLDQNINYPECNRFFRYE